MTDFGALIKNRRQQLGLTLEQVGDQCGVGKSTVRKWEKGMIRNVGRDKISLLAKVLRMDPVDLIDLGESASTGTLSPAELELLAAYRAADDRARQDAMNTLKQHPRQS